MGIGTYRRPAYDVIYLYKGFYISYAPCGVHRRGGFSPPRHVAYGATVRAVLADAIAVKLSHLCRRRPGVTMVLECISSHAGADAPQLMSAATTLHLAEFGTCGPSSVQEAYLAASLRCFRLRLRVRGAALHCNVRTDCLLREPSHPAVVYPTPWNVPQVCSPAVQVPLLTLPRTHVAFTRFPWRVAIRPPRLCPWYTLEDPISF